MADEKEEMKKKNKEKTKKFKRVVGIAFLIAFIVAILDIFASEFFWKAMGEMRHEAYILAETPYLNLFWYFVYAIIIISAISYYIASKDKSESIGVGVVSFLFIKSGLTDVLYFCLQAKPIPESMPWLINTSAGVVSKHILNLSTVNPLGLLLNMIIMVGLSIYITKYLFEKW